jgi:hypothetical protein
MRVEPYHTPDQLVALIRTHYACRLICPRSLCRRTRPI